MHIYKATVRSLESELIILVRLPHSELCKFQISLWGWVCLYVVQTVTKFTHSLSKRRASFAPYEASKDSLVILGGTRGFVGGAKRNSHCSIHVAISLVLDASINERCQYRALGMCSNQRKTLWGKFLFPPHILFSFSAL
jgi:hypothetical protein